MPRLYGAAKLLARPALRRWSAGHRSTPIGPGAVAATTLHIYQTPQHLVEVSYAYREVDGVLGALRCIRSQFLQSGFPRRPLLGNLVNKGVVCLSSDALVKRKALL